MPQSPAVLGAPLAASPRMTGGARRVSRDEIVGLAKQGRVWEFVPLALRALAHHPEDHGLRLLLATSYARLGLRTPTVEQVELLPRVLQSESSVVALRQALHAFPADEIALEDRVERCRSNLDVLRSRGVDHFLSFLRWVEQTAGERWFVCGDGNIVRRSAILAPDGAWLYFRNDRADALTLAFPHLQERDKPARPYVVEGAFPPWVLQRLYELTPDAPDGYRTRISVVQVDPKEAMDGLACADLRALLADTRVELFVGDSAGERYAAALTRRHAIKAGGPAIVLSTVRTPAAPAVLESLERFAKEQHEEHTRLSGEVERLYAERDHGWWRARYTSPATPLRVLIPTCRYTTFVKHSAADLSEAFRGMGWEAKVLIEPDECSHLASVAYLRELAEYQPDLVVLINYARTTVGNFFPASVPYVCWIQDAMPRQFDAALAARQGPFDFLAGHIHHELFTRHGFDRRRSMVWPVAVSPRKFHPGRPGHSRERFECEVAYVSHHSETSDALHARLVAEAGATDPRGARILEELRPRVQEIARDPLTYTGSIELEEAVRAGARRVLGADAPEETITLIMRQYCLPLADRMLRHETLEWAARIAARRGWRLHIHGRGWERHPTLAAFARGELAHDEELREAYGAARVHLHASSSWLLHQRVMECALSGGLPLVRLKKGDLVQWEQSVLHTLSRESGIIMERRTPLMYREYGFAVADHPAAMEYMSQLQRLGMPATWDLWVHGARYDEFRGIDAPGAEPPAGWMLGDLAETTFRSDEDLERLLARGVEDDSWRSRTSGLIASRIRRRYTTDSLAASLRALVEAELDRVCNGEQAISPIPASSK